MTEKEIRKIIKQEIKQQVNEIRDIMEAENTYKRIEKMLYNYEFLKNRIPKLQENLENIVLKKCSGVAGGFGNTKYEYKSDLEKIEDIRLRNEITISKMQEIVNLIEYGIAEVKKDKYYEILELRYFEKLSIEKIAEKIGIGETTVKRHKNRLIQELRVIMFPEEFLQGF